MAEAGISPSVAAVDFGRIREADGPTARRLFVRNNDSVPLALLKVAPSCGCTAVNFQQEEFAPGDSAWVDLEYDPAFRPGSFEKSVRIYSTNGDLIRVPVRGVVEASESTVNELFPVAAGLLHFTETTFIPPLNHPLRPRTFFADAYNSSEFPVWIEIVNDNQAIVAAVEPNPVPPMDKATVSLYLDLDKEDREGITRYSVNLYNSYSSEDITDSDPVEFKIILENHGTP